MDRLLSMMLGLPQGTTDTSMGSPSAMLHETPMGRLERQHAVIACRILERKDRDPSASYTRREIDTDLLKAASSMPAKFWLQPDLTALQAGSKEEFWETLRLVNHLVHYNMIIQLHLPFLLRSGGPQPNRCTYSKSACVNASREILTRYISYLSINPYATCSRFFAVPAAMALLLAHLDSHHHGEADNFLAHQRLSDRAMVERIMESIEDVDQIWDAEKGHHILKDLLQIEAEASGGQSYEARSMQGDDDDAPDGEEGDTFRISVPYFGVIKITKQGGISKEALQEHVEVTASGGEGASLHDGTFGMGSVHASNQFYSSQAKKGMLPLGQLGFSTDYYPLLSEIAPADSIGPAAEQYPSDLDGQNQYMLPGLTAGFQDWALQGVDNAFFDNLMVGSEGQSGGLGESAGWTPGWQGDGSLGQQ